MGPDVGPGVERTRHTHGYVDEHCVLLPALALKRNLLPVFKKQPLGRLGLEMLDK